MQGKPATFCVKGASSDDALWGVRRGCHWRIQNPQRLLGRKR
jgi:hypothetical protein